MKGIPKKVDYKKKKLEIDGLTIHQVIEYLSECWATIPEPYREEAHINIYTEHYYDSSSCVIELEWKEIESDEDYEVRVQEFKKKERERLKAQKLEKEERDRKEYERLKKKFEGK